MAQPGGGEGNATYVYVCNDFYDDEADCVPRIDIDTESKSIYLNYLGLPQVY